MGMTSAEFLERFAKATPQKVEALDGAGVWVRRPTFKRRESIELAAMAARLGEGKADFRARVLAACLCDESGAFLFDPIEDVAKLADLSVELEPAFEASVKLCGFTKNEVENLEKNSQSVQS